MKVLMIGDVIARGGRRTLSKLLPGIKEEFSIDYVIAQGENSAGGFGHTLETTHEMIEAGVDIITSGNHVWDKKDFIEDLSKFTVPVIRPLNYPEIAPGRGAIDLGPIAVINLIGRVYMGEFDSPFTQVDRLLSQGFGKDKPLFIDFHAETTSEKAAMGWFLDGKISAIVGTHTHVRTADCKILNKGTGFVSDLGMVGAVDSVIGIKSEDSLSRFLTGIPTRFNPVNEGRMMFCSVLIEVDEKTNLTTSITRVDRETFI